MSPEISGREGGIARAEKLSPEARKEIAVKAARARWAEPTAKLARATHAGPWRVDDLEIHCAVLDDGARVLTQQGVLTALGRARSAKGGQGASVVDDLPAFLAASNLKRFISDDLSASTTPIVFVTKTGARAFGYRAELLADICWVFINARLEGKLTHMQQHIAERCQMLVRAFGKVGIIALVDEATGYQADRERDELQRILERYIVEEMRRWVRTFPSEFFRQVYRLHGWTYRTGDTRTPRYVGKFIDKHIYKPLPPGVRDELRERNPSIDGQRKHKNFQFLTEDAGVPHLTEQIRAVTVLMKGADNKAAFERSFKRVFPAPGDQTELSLAPSESDAPSDSADK